LIFGLVAHFVLTYTRESKAAAIAEGSRP